MTRSHLGSAVAVFLAVCVGAPGARAAADSLCGTTITSDLVLTEDVDCTRHPGKAITIGADGVTIEGNGHKIVAPDSSYAIYSSGFDNLAVRNVDIRGWCTGYGIYFEMGDGLVVDNVNAEGRSTGLYAYQSSNVTVRDFRADGSVTYGAVLSSLTGSLTLERLSLTNNGTGLYVASVSGLTLGPESIVDLGGNDVGIDLAGTVTNLSVIGVRAQGRSYGIRSATSNSQLSFTGVDASGVAGAGTGLQLNGGTNVTIKDFKADRRAYGLNTVGVNGLTLHGASAVGSKATAFYLQNTTGALSLKNITATDGYWGLYVSGYTAPATTPLVLAAYEPATDSGALGDLRRNEGGLILYEVTNAVVGAPPPKPPLRLDGMIYGLYAQASTDLRIQNVDVSGTASGGKGLYMSGTRLSVSGLVADERTDGIDVTSATDLSLSDIRSDNTRTTGVALANVTRPLSLERLAITRSAGTGLRITNFAGDPAAPFLLGRWVAGTGGAIETLDGSATTLTLNNVQQMKLDGLRLDGRDLGLDAYYITNADLEIVDVDASAAGTGYGIELQGSRIEVTGAKANDRANSGLYVYRVDGLTVTDLEATGCGTGMTLYGLTTDHAAPSFNGLDLRNSGTAVAVHYCSRPIVIDGDDARLDVAGSANGFTFANSSKITLRDLKLPTTSGTAIDVTATCGQLTFDHVDVSGPGRGTGINIAGGPDYVLNNVVASHRNVGVVLTKTSKLILTDLTASHNASYGLELVSSKASEGDLPATIQRLDLSHNLYGLYMASWELPLTFDGNDPNATLDLSGTGLGVTIYYAKGVTFKNLTIPSVTSAINVIGTSESLTFENLDLRGTGFGYGLQLGSGTLAWTRAGANHVIRNVDASDRGVGVTVIAADNLVIDRLTASRCQSNGLVLSDIDTTTGLSLRELRLARAGMGLSLTRVNGTETAPFAFDAFDFGNPLDPGDDRGAIADLSDSDYGVYASTCDWLRFEGFSANGRTAGVTLSGGADNAIVGVDASGADRIGYGISLQGGSRVTVSGVTADNRERGVYANQTAGITVSSLRADSCTTGLYIDRNTAVPTLKTLSLTRCYTGLDIRTLTGPLDIGPGAITTLSGSEYGFYLAGTSNVRVHDLDLSRQNRTAAISAGASDNVGLVLEGLKVSGRGQGWGLYVGGTGATMRNIEANDRRIGVELYSPVAAVLDDVRVKRARAQAIYLSSPSASLTATRLALEDNVDGFHAVGGNLTANPVTLGTGHFASLSGNNRDIYAATPGLTVDTAGLGLSNDTGSSYYKLPMRVATAPGPDAACGKVLDGVTVPAGSAALALGPGGYVLVADLDCSATIGVPAIELGADDITFDGANHAILAPHVPSAIKVSGKANATIKNVDLSGTHGGGYGLDVATSSGLTVTNVIANDRHEGFYLRTTNGVILGGLTANRAVNVGLRLDTLSGVLGLSGLTLRDGAHYGLWVTGVDGDPSDVAGPLLLDGAVLLDVTGNDNSIGLADAHDFHLTGTASAPLVLDGAESGLNASAANNSGISLTYADLTPAGFAGGAGGNGADLGGTGVTLAHIRADHRAYGVKATGVAGLSLEDVSVGHATSYALYLKSLPTTPSLSGLRLTDSNYGFYADGLAGAAGAPLVLDKSVFLDLDGSSYPLTFYNADYVTVGGAAGDRLVVDAVTTAVTAAGGVSSPNRHFTLAHLELPFRSASTTGLNLGGDDYVVEDVLTYGFATGVSVTSGERLAMSGVEARNARTYGLSLSSLPDPTLSGLRATGCATGFYFNKVTPTARLVIDKTVIPAVSRNYNDIIVQDSSNLTFKDLVLTGHDAGLLAYYLANSGLHFEGLTVSGTRHLGYGLRVYGADVVVKDLTANDRAYGLEAAYVTNFALDGLVADGDTAGGSSGYALSLYEAKGTVSLSRLAITNAGTAVKLERVPGDAGAPVVFDESVYLPALDALGNRVPRGSTTDFLLRNAHHLRFEGLRLDAETYAVEGWDPTNGDLAFTDVDASGIRAGAGIGFYVQGPRLEFTRCRADRRYYGFLGGRNDGIVIDDLRVRLAAYALYLYLYPASFTPPSIAGLSLTESTTGLLFYDWDYPLTLDGESSLALGGGVPIFAGNGTDIMVQGGSSNLTFKHLDLDGRTAGFRSDANDNVALALEDIDASGLHSGDGLVLYGDDISLTDIRVTGRRYPVEAVGTSNLDISGLTVSRSNLVYIHDFTAADAPPSLSNISVSDGNYGLVFANMATTPPLAVDGQASNLVFDNLLYGFYLSGVSPGVTVKNLDVRGARLVGVYLPDTKISACALENVDASGHGYGTGFSVGGTDVSLTGCRASDRDVGLENYTATVNLSLSDFEARRAGTAGIRLSNATTPSFSNVRITDSTQALSLTTVTGGGLVIDGSALTETSGNYEQIIVSDSQDIVLADLTLPSTGTGVSVHGRFTRNVAIRDVDVSGYCLGYGAIAAGTNVTLERVTAGRRTDAVYIGSGDGLLVKDSVMGASTRGLNVAGRTLLLDDQVVANVTNSATQFQVSVDTTGTINLAVGTSIDVHLPTGTERVTVTARSGVYVTVSPALSAIPPAGTVVRDVAVTGAPRIVVASSDICANATGFVQTGSEVAATDNYWRSSNGPTSPLVPGGDGDKVTASGTVTLSPFLTVPSDKVNLYCNQAPVAEAGDDQSVCEGDVVTLDATASYDPDVEPVSYAWTQQAGPDVGAVAAVAEPTFTAPTPEVGSDLATLFFELAVDDGDIQRTDTVSIAVARGHALPTADAGSGQAVDEGDPVTLDGSASSDPEGLALSYLWEQIDGGEAVSLSDPNAVSPTFTAPALGAGGGAATRTLTFRLTVTDLEPAGRCGGRKSRSATFDVVVSALVCVVTGDDTNCDGVDDDCDGTPDNHFVPAETTCGEGACAATGTTTCVDGVPGDSCTPLAGAQPEVCNGVDDDCDGPVDEGLDAVTVDCTLPGGCAGVLTQSCVGGSLVATAPCALPAPITDLCDGVDDDCDGSTDEDFVAEPVPCGADACGVGQGLTTCVAGLAGDTCDPLWSGIPDTTCSDGTTGLRAIYIIATGPTGAPVGTIRCFQDLDLPGTPVACNTIPGTDEALVHPELWCEGVQP